MLAGEPPFTGPTAQAIIAKRFARRPRRCGSCARRCRRRRGRRSREALARAPADRFATAAEIRPRARRDGGLAPVVHRRRRDRSHRPSPARAGAGAGPVTLLALVSASLIGLGVLFAWRRDHGASGEPRHGVAAIAVLPFENLGDTERRVLRRWRHRRGPRQAAALPGLVVIARASSGQYRGPPKAPQRDRAASSACSTSSPARCAGPRRATARAGCR